MSWPRSAKDYLPPLVVCGIVLATLTQFLEAGFVSSDWWPVLASNHLSSPQDLLRFFEEPIGAQSEMFVAQLGRHYRPLSALSYAIDFHIWGLDKPWGWQITNLAIHLGVTLGVYALSRALGLARWAAVLAAAVFTLHPAIVSTVPGIARRHDTLSALFLVLSILSMLRRRLALSMVLFACSVLAKEISLAMLPLIPLLAGIAGRPMWWGLAPAVGGGLALGLRLLVLGGLGGYGTAALPSSFALAPYWEPLVQYFEHLLWPMGEFDGYRYVANAALVMSLIALGAAAMLPRLERRLVLFGLAWVYAAGLLYAFVKVYSGAWYLYQPLIGFALLIAGMASGGWSLRIRESRARSLLPLLFAVSASVLIVRSAPPWTQYPEWVDVGRRVDLYLTFLDNCSAEGESVPFAPQNRGRSTSITAATGLAEYSIHSYLQLAHPDGRACKVR